VAENQKFVISNEGEKSSISRYFIPQNDKRKNSFFAL